MIAMAAPFRICIILLFALLGPLLRLREEPIDQEYENKKIAHEEGGAQIYHANAP
jgi:hypothetical protein